MKRYEFDEHGDPIAISGGEWIRYEDHVDAMKRIAGDGAQQAEPDEDDEESEGAVMPVHWDLFPGWLIDHHEGDTITEELLQSALADMLKVHPVAPAPSASPADQGEDARTEPTLMVPVEELVEALGHAKSLLEELPAHTVSGTRTAYAYNMVSAAINKVQRAAMSASKEGGAHPGCPYPASCDAIQQCYGGCKRHANKEGS